MNPYLVYQPRSTTGWTRFDQLLALFDALLDRAERAARLLRQGDGAAGRAVLVNARLLVDGLLAGLAPGGEAAGDLLHLCDFVGRQLGAGRAEQIETALPLLRTAREAFVALRFESLERVSA